MKGNKPTSVPPVTAMGKVKIDDSLENPRGYLSGIDDGIKEGHTKIAADLDPHDKERNENRVRRGVKNTPEPNVG